MIAPQLADPSVVAWYRALVEEDASMAPMLQLVQHVSSQEYASLVPAGTSLLTLVIGKYEQDNVTAAYWPDRRLFQICYWNSRPERREAHVCELEAAKRLVDCFVLRLLVTARAGADPS